MIGHLLKVVWSRKRTNALIVIEIFVSFLVVFAVMAGAVSFLNNWRHPVGFDWHDVWNVRADIELEADPEKDPGVLQAMMRLVEEARSLPEVEAAAAANTPPYSFSTWVSNTKTSGRSVDLTMDNVTDDYAAVMRMKVLRGRWFSPEDDAAQYRPTVIDATAAKALFGDDDPIGRKITFQNDEKGTLRVVGVVETYRKDGETSDPVNMVFRRISADPKFSGVLRNIIVRVRPGTPADFERTLLDRFQAVQPEMSFRLQRMDRMRRDALRIRLAPILLGSVVSLFLVSMVALGLTGVLWQNVTRRTRELGLRRAIGATGGAVHRQILLEVVLLATIAVVAGGVVIAQLPILGVFRLVSPAAYTTALFGALATVYALTIACGLYPSWLAARLQPADALRYE